MGIDAYFCRTESGKIEAEGEVERVTGVDGFLATAYTFGMALEPIREFANMAPEEMKAAIVAAVADFDEYVESHRAAGTKRFKEYFEFVRRTVGQIKAEGKQSVFGPSLYEQLPLEAVDEDAQAFFGWFMLGNRAIGPEEAATVAPMLGLARGMLNASIPNWEQQNADYAAMMRDAHEILGTVAKFCDAAAEESRSFYLDS